jgi:hypothetical protein
MNKFFLIILVCLGCMQMHTFAQANIIALRINPYSDSVKIVDQLSYFVNVESIYNDKTIYPVTENEVTISSTFGKINGMSIFFNKQIAPDSFMVTATLNTNKNITVQKILYVQKINLDANIMQEPIMQTTDTISTKPKPIIKKKRKKFF